MTDDGDRAFDAWKNDHVCRDGTVEGICYDGKCGRVKFASGWYRVYEAVPLWNKALSRLSAECEEMRFRNADLSARNRELEAR